MKKSHTGWIRNGGKYRALTYHFTSGIRVGGRSAIPTTAMASGPCKALGMA
jgi:hypothetical protein